MISQPMTVTVQAAILVQNSVLVPVAVLILGPLPVPVKMRMQKRKKELQKGENGILGIVREEGAVGSRIRCIKIRGGPSREGSRTGETTQIIMETGGGGEATVATEGDMMI